VQPDIHIRLKWFWVVQFSKIVQFIGAYKLNIIYVPISSQWSVIVSVNHHASKILSAMELVLRHSFVLKRYLQRWNEYLNRPKPPLISDMRLLSVVSDGC